MKKLSLLLFILCCFVELAHATHNRAGEITYEQISQYYYKVTITTYTKTSSPADRPELEIWWGDGTRDTIPRVFFQDNFGGAGSDIRKNIYYGYHTYPGPSVYKIYFEDPNRNGGVINIPNSINVPFYVETMLIIFPSLGFNNSPVLLQPPIDEGVVGQVFVHNPNAYDPDGDSLSYELIYCKSAGGIDIPGYTYPSASNSFSLNAVTGDLIWDSPVSCGEFNVAFLIREWRNGFNIGYVERDMQINILCNNPNNNQPPQFSSVQDTCVIAGTFISFPVSATDPNSTNTVTLTATGGPLQQTVSPAQFNQPVSGTPTVTQTFQWQTDCEHVQKTPYQMVFKAKDNDPNVQLVSLQTVRIKVIAPAPQNPVAVPSGNTIQLSWDVSPCPQAIGYKIYRRKGGFPFVPGPCETGVPSYTGYSFIASVNGLSNTSYIDNNGGSGLEPATEYCYRVIAYFADGAESISSDEVCATLKKDLPVLTNVSVTTTDAVNGTMYVAWSKPSDLDTAQWPAPYEYRIFRSSSSSPSSFVQVGSNTSINDTLFNDSGINTLDESFNYRIDLYASPSGTLQLVGPSQEASSVFLSIVPSDEKLILNWQYSVPWKNDTTVIYRFDGSSYNSIGFSTTNIYTDSLLNNGELYCYYVMTKGLYLTSGYVDPILNNSQEACDRPYDNVPPCPIATDTLDFDCAAGVITLGWQVPPVECADDVMEYYIYYASAPGEPYTILATVPDGAATSYTYTAPSSVAGCYYVAAVDSNGNIGAPNNSICVDNCPFYELPVVFTPDGNNINDFFVPFPYRNVRDIELKIFNRWGQVVFETTDPDIGWNGKSNNTGQDLPEGVYFYICKVNEIYLDGIRQRVLKPGTIQLLRK
ncbi:MAG TPA: gliding motility-associated C-terminal domain-containing protein [Bacteroidia bacterium]|nr:gliding motility-associated C-terminal domain-containing protein [Bacteroidia bacterium]